MVSVVFLLTGAYLTCGEKLLKLLEFKQEPKCKQSAAWVRQQCRFILGRIFLHQVGINKYNCYADLCL